MTNYVVTLVKTNVKQPGPLETKVYTEQNDAYSARTLAENQYSGYKAVSVLLNN